MHPRTASKTAALALAAILAPAAAFAAEPYLPRHPASFARLDADKNGAISPAELKPKAERRLLRFDGDGNREVTAAEIDAHLQKIMANRRARLMAALDGDGNGAITVAELDKYVEAMFNGADTDGDGGVTLEEARAFRIAKWRKPQPEPDAN